MAGSGLCRDGSTVVSRTDINRFHYHYHYHYHYGYGYGYGYSATAPEVCNC